MDIRLPLGVESFAKIREGGYYYIDKTAFIRELLGRQFEANLIARPRRFGKTLTMSMLDDFFDISRDSEADFAGLEIAKEEALCEEWRNKWPVVFLSLKSVEGLRFEDAYGRFTVLMADLCKRYMFLGESKKVMPEDRKLFGELTAQKADAQNLMGCLLLLTRMMSAHYGKQAILLIDEYDVPLAKASENGYYREMLDMVRSLLGNALKTNPYLKFAVVTGCLRIAKESIFTGINNLVIDDISGGGFAEYIGFTPTEVRRLLEDAGLPEQMGKVRDWYDGYRFGRTEIYCPWSVLNYLSSLQSDPEAKPRNYWANTSHNSVIYQFIKREDLNVKRKLETLLDGGVVVTPIEENLTYDYIRSSEVNFWSLLYMTGYLTGADPGSLEVEPPEGSAALRIPNEEIRSIFRKSVVEWYNDLVRGMDRRELFEALWKGEAEKAQELVSDLLFRTISYHDYRESYYHAFLVGLFAGAGYAVESNLEYGRGRPDVVVLDDLHRRALVIEAKHARTEGEIPAKCREAAEQFARERYLEGIEKGYRTRIGYGMVFHEKDCVIVKIADRSGPGNIGFRAD